MYNWVLQRRKLHRLALFRPRCQRSTLWRSTTSRHTQVLTVSLRSTKSGSTAMTTVTAAVQHRLHNLLFVRNFSKILLPLNPFGFGVPVLTHATNATNSTSTSNCFVKPKTTGTTDTTFTNDASAIANSTEAPSAGTATSSNPIASPLTITSITAYYNTTTSAGTSTGGSTSFIAGTEHNAITRSLLEFQFAETWCGNATTDASATTSIPVLGRRLLNHRKYSVGREMFLEQLRRRPPKRHELPNQQK
ncbi:hypothetical protein Pelo_14884 [Pelomyxa schiedti]|nr:hypothetical protein Pelo_14884 [Pelomyxa schiedti]